MYFNISDFLEELESLAYSGNKAAKTIFGMV